MAVINLYDYSMIWTWNHQQPNLEPANRIDQKKDHAWFRYWLEELDAREEQFWYVEIFLNDAFKVYNLDELMPRELFDKLKAGEISIAIGNAGHGYHHIVEALYTDIIMKYDISPDNVLFRSESYDMNLELDFISKKLNMPKFRLEWTLEFEHMYGMDAKTGNINIPTLEHKEYDKKFLSFNGLFRPHRGLIVFLLESLGVLDKGYVSYNSKGGAGTAKEVLENFMSIHHKLPEMHSLFELNRDKLEKLDALYLDDTQSDFVVNNTVKSQSEHNFYYENTYFSLVTETSFTNKWYNPHHLNTNNTDTGRILSEKIFKPIISKHPFIVVSNYRTLWLLKSIGYKSFSPWIDESYDEIEHDGERLLAIAKEVKRLCELSPDELSEFLTHCKEICEYNYNVLKDKKIFHYSLPRL